MARLHPDFPETPEGHSNSWDLPDPLSDIEMSLYLVEDIDLSDIAEVDSYYIDSTQGIWAPGGSVGTELDLNILARLHDDRWVAIEAWNDYTGWGCQDHSNVYIGSSREDAIRNGLTQDARNAMGLTLSDSS